MRLLIVEDEEDMREALCYGLRRRGYAVDAAGDGADAVEQCGNLMVKIDSKYNIS